MTWIFTQNEANDRSVDYSDQGRYAFTLTFEGYPQGEPTTRTVGVGPDSVTYAIPGKWGCYTGTLNLEKGESPFRIQANVCAFIQAQSGITVSKIIFWDLRPNRF